MGLKKGNEDWSCPTGYRMPRFFEYALAEECLETTDYVDIPDGYTWPGYDEGYRHLGIGWSATGVFDTTKCNCNCAELSLDLTTSGSTSCLASPFSRSPRGRRIDTRVRRCRRPRIILDITP